MSAKMETLILRKYEAIVMPEKEKVNVSKVITMEGLLKRLGSCMSFSMATKQERRKGYDFSVNCVHCIFHHCCGNCE